MDKVCLLPPSGLSSYISSSGLCGSLPALGLRDLSSVMGACVDHGIGVIAQADGLGCMSAPSASAADHYLSADQQDG